MKCKTGITGNLYFFSEDKSEIESVCEKIGKSIKSIYFNKKYSVWAIRIKNKKQKIKAKRVIMENPIVDNRLVKDKTFALRLLGFALDIQCADACSEDEKESMISYACSLLDYQINTATDKDEIDYLNRCKAKNKLLKGLMFLGKKSY